VRQRIGRALTISNSKSKELLDLKYKKNFEEIFRETVTYCAENGLIENRI